MTGIDNNPKVARNYPYEFVLGDALSLTVEYLRGFDLVHLGGPCQPWSKMLNCWPPAVRARYKDLILPLRPKLQASGVPYVIENVEGAPLVGATWLCAVAFGYPELIRHRGFESGNGLVIPALHHPAHPLPASKAGHWVPGTAMSIAGHVAPMWKARELMAVTRKVTRDGLVEAAPSYMTAYVASHAAAYLSSRKAAL